MKYVYTWGNNTKRAEYKGCICEIVKAMKRNSVVLRFEDGRMLCTSRFAIRKCCVENHAH